MPNEEMVEGYIWVLLHSQEGHPCQKKKMIDGQCGALPLACDIDVTHGARSKLRGPSKNKT
jgi:hypothetical protein